LQAWFLSFLRFLADRHKSPLPPKVVLPSGVPIDLVRRTTAPPDSHRKQHRPFDDDLTSISAPFPCQQDTGKPRPWLWSITTAVTCVTYVLTVQSASQPKELAASTPLE